MPPNPFPLHEGQRGAAIVDLQRRLGAAGYLSGSVAEVGLFCSATKEALTAFQVARGLAVDGLCGAYTWAGLVEASWKRGSRLLLLTAPNMRGDDVAELQSELGRLGFDCGKVDGIFGPLTAGALVDFQRNCGLVVDGVYGTVTLQAVERIRRQSGTGPGIATMPERDQIHSRSSSLRELRVVIGHFGGLSPLTRAVARELRSSGAAVISVDEPDPRLQATIANNFGAHLYVGFESSADGTTHISYYAVPTFESAAGRSLAERLFEDVSPIAAFDPPPVRGMRLQVLRETRMPAVLVSLSSVRRTIDRTQEITQAVKASLQCWAQGSISTS